MKGFGAAPTRGFMPELLRGASGWAQRAPAAAEGKGQIMTTNRTPTELRGMSTLPGRNWVRVATADSAAAGRRLGSSKAGKARISDGGGERVAVVIIAVLLLAILNVAARNYIESNAQPITVEWLVSP